MSTKLGKNALLPVSRERIASPYDGPGRHRRSPSGVALWAEHPELVDSIRRAHVDNGHKRCAVCTTSTGGHVRWPCGLAEAAGAAAALLGVA